MSALLAILLLLVILKGAPVRTKGTTASNVAACVAWFGVMAALLLALLVNEGRWPQ